MYFKPEELVVETPTRSPKPVSQTAENITVVTASDIELMNAHTLADVLNTIPGVEVWLEGGPGIVAQATILGSNDRHVTVILDGVILNPPSSGIMEVGTIPVQNIEKVEVIKGPASSAWGSALGGVVNIITKSGQNMEQGGVVYASGGPNGFGDFRVEGRGKEEKLYYYITAGRLQSNGLTPHFTVSENNAYAKVGYDLTEKTDIRFTLAYRRAFEDDYYNNFSPDPTFAGAGNDLLHYVVSTLGVNSALSNNLDLNVSVWSYHNYDNQGFADLTTGDSSYTKDTVMGYGSSAKLTWKSDRQTAVFGFDSSYMSDEVFFLPDGKQRIDKWAIYANDTLVFNRFSVTPGVRFDSTDSNGDVTSPSLGITYSLGDSTILRAYAAHGFNVPLTSDTFGFANGWLGNPDLKMETVWSYQAGVETAALNYVWMKLSVFRNEMRNGIQTITLPSGDLQNQNIGRERRQGAVIEARTKPLYNTSLSAGAEFNTAKDLNTGQTILEVPTQVYDIGLRYDDQQSFKAVLLGRHINWNAPVDDMSQYHSMIIDLNMDKKIFERKNASLEVFATGHNLLNTAQYLKANRPNPKRWLEAGLKFNF